MVLSGTAGAALGVLLGLMWLLAGAGETVEAVAVGALIVVLGLAVLFQLVLARAVARIYDGLAVRPTRDGDLERRLAALEEQLVSLERGG